MKAEIIDREFVTKVISQILYFVILVLTTSSNMMISSMAVMLTCVIFAIVLTYFAMIFYNLFFNYPYLKEVFDQELSNFFSFNNIFNLIMAWVNTYYAYTLGIYYLWPLMIICLVSSILITIWMKITIQNP